MTQDKQECAVCYEEMDGDVGALGCGHKFCRKCIFEWAAQYNLTCPMCREPMTYAGYLKVTGQERLVAKGVTPNSISMETMMETPPNADDAEACERHLVYRVQRHIAFSDMLKVAYATGKVPDNF
jgi:hypothetical protein